MGLRLKNWTKMQMYIIVKGNKTIKYEHFILIEVTS